LNLRPLGYECSFPVQMVFHSLYIFRNWSAAGDWYVIMP